MIIYVVILVDRNVIKKLINVTEKILKRKELKVEIQGMWNVKTKLIPVTTGANETSSKSLRECLSNITCKARI
jgi:hypothetical protein